MGSDIENLDSYKWDESKFKDMPPNVWQIEIRKLREEDKRLRDALKESLIYVLYMKRYHTLEHEEADGNPSIENTIEQALKEKEPNWKGWEKSAQAALDWMQSGGTINSDNSKVNIALLEENKRLRDASQRVIKDMDGLPYEVSPWTMEALKQALKENK